jgi:hypothetical protein
MPDLLTILSRWWKAILGLTVAVALIALFILISSQKQYLSVVTALPANSLGFDKAKIFNNNIQELYSSLGTPDELDPVVGTGKLDTLYIAIAKDYNLVHHYSLENKKNQLYTATKFLKANSAIVKDEFGQLKIKVWDVDAEMAATLAHALFERLQELHQYLQNQSNEMVLAKLKEDYKQKTGFMTSARRMATDTAGDNTATRSADTTSKQLTEIPSSEELNEYRKLISEYSLMATTKPQALILVEDARPDIKPDRPKFVLVFSISIAGAILFGILLAVFLESRKR